MQLKTPGTKCSEFRIVKVSMYAKQIFLNSHPVVHNAEFNVFLLLWGFCIILRVLDILETSVYKFYVQFIVRFIVK